MVMGLGGLDWVRWREGGDFGLSIINQKRGFFEERESHF